MRSKSPTNIQFTSSMNGDSIDLEGQDIRQDRGDWQVAVKKNQTVVLRIARPKGVDGTFSATSSMNEAEDETWQVDEEGVQSSEIFEAGELKLDLSWTGSDGKVASAAPIIIITKGGKPDDLTDPADDTDPQSTEE